MITRLLQTLYVLRQFRAMGASLHDLAHDAQELLQDQYLLAEWLETTGYHRRNGR